MAAVFEQPIKPAYYDFDPSGVIHNTVYVRWLEDVRVAFQEAGPWPPERLYAEDIAPALTRTEITYAAPVRQGDLVMARARITRVGRSAWALAYAFVHPETGRSYPSGEQSGCFIRRATGKPVPMPTEFADYCRRYLE